MHQLYDKPVIEWLFASENANYEEDSVSESRVSSRSRSSQTDQRDGVIDYDSAPDYPGRGRSGGGVGNNKKKKIPPGHQGRDPSSLPPGLAKKQQNNGNGGSGFNNRPIDGYDDIDQVERNVRLFKLSELQN